MQEMSNKELSKKFSVRNLKEFKDDLGITSPLADRGPKLNESISETTGQQATDECLLPLQKDKPILRRLDFDMSPDLLRKNRTEATPDENGRGNLSSIYMARKVRPGNLVKRKLTYSGQVPEAFYPVPHMTSNDYQKRLSFDELKKTRLEALVNWKKRDQVGLKKNAYIKEIQKKNENILGITAKDELERLEVQTDRLPLLGCRKAFWRLLITVSMLCKYVIETDLFSNLTIAVILVNSIYMMFDNPLENNPPEWSGTVEDGFTYFYTWEAFMKIIGMGLIFTEGAYLHDPGNVLDCFIVVMSYPDKFTQSGLNISYKQEVGIRKETASSMSL